MTKYTPTPWHLCKNGECKCLTIWGNNHPVTKIYSGKWGDEFPSVRIIGDSSLSLKAEPFIDMIAYGEISEETAKANAKLIIEAVNNYTLNDNDKIKLNDIVWYKENNNIKKSLAKVISKHNDIYCILLLNNTKKIVSEIQINKAFIYQIFDLLLDEKIKEEE